MPPAVVPEPIVVVAGSVHYDLLLQLPALPGDNDRLTPHAMTLAPGGMGGNVAAAIGRLGGQVRFVGAFADDEEGDRLCTDLERDGVDCSWATRHGRAIPYRGLILVGPDGERAIIGGLPIGDILPYAPGQAPGNVVEPPAWRGRAEVTIDPAALVGDNVAVACPFTHLPAVIAQVPAEVPIYTDIETGHVTDWSADEIWGALRRPVVLYGNHRTLNDLTRRLDLASVMELARKRGGPVIETAGEFGCVVHNRGTRNIVPGYATETVDSSGAGDCFAATCTLFLRRGLSLLEAARRANVAASLSTRRLGCRPGIPTATELDDVLATLPGGEPMPPPTTSRRRVRPVVKRAAPIAARGDLSA